MRAVITAIRQSNGRAAAKTDGKDYSIIKFTKGVEVGVGDVVSWENDAVEGDGILIVEPTGRKVPVIFQNHSVPGYQVQMQLGP